MTKLTQLHTDALLHVAPTFFEQTRRSPFSECGFEVEDGWYNLLLDAFVAIEAIAVDLPVDARVTCAQVKEKFGILRIYYDGRAHPAIDTIITQAELRSAKTCESCGHINGVHRRP